MGIEPPAWSKRLRAAWLPIAAAALVIITFMVAGGLSPIWGVLGFLVLAGVALLAAQAPNQDAQHGLTQAPERTEAADLETMLGALPDPVIALDQKARVVAFNAAARAVAPALSRHQPVSFALRMPALTEAIRHALATRQARCFEFSERVPIERWYAAHVMPNSRSADPYGGAAFFLTLHDLTPLRRVEEMRADFVANASHELRTPLAALSGFIDTLQGPAKDDVKARERFLGIMHNQATRMARLIDDLLSLSRVELSAHVRPDTLVDLVPIIRQVADGLEPLARERQVAIEVDLPEPPVAIAGDREELLRLFENLIENALKYGASGGRVIVSLTTASSGEGAPEYRVMVRDFGPGIAPEHLPRLTERFYRVDVGDSRAQGGTGLGLSLVKHILSRHRGRLLIESVPKNGAVFTACFPQPKPPM